MRTIHLCQHVTTHPNLVASATVAGHRRAGTLATLFRSVWFIYRYRGQEFATREFTLIDDGGARCRRDAVIEILGAAPDDIVYACELHSVKMVHAEATVIRPVTRGDRLDA
ncbi:hypothetical protein [Phycicoccus sp.]|uniref:hypothetical protein n=1 Tax=Phycicoccus sp. TaxID=1902410 RepID=UPI002CCC8C07|nr:hypothetical protein [Phycicoccus sp.]HMM95297.1 hypothetical protein [Phycicoccus sp.]